MSRALLLVLFALFAAVCTPAIVEWWSRPWEVFFGQRSGWWYGDDFAVFYSAGHLVATGAWASLYDASAHIHANSELAFFNPPFFALFFAPFAAMSEERAFQAWTVI